MSSSKVRPTVDELYATLKNSSIPTVLVEGIDDIVFYRRIEQDLNDVGIDMLPAGNKGAVLELRDKIISTPINTSVVFVVDKDLWVYDDTFDIASDVITTDGYSIENDIFCDGELLELMTPDELQSFNRDLHKFVRWYAIAVNRSQLGGHCSYRETPHRVLSDEIFYSSSIALNEDETYPETFFSNIRDNYGRLLRGKSLFSLLVIQLSRRERRTKFGTNQLMEVGAARKGLRYQMLRDKIRSAFEAA